MKAQLANVITPERQKMSVLFRVRKVKVIRGLVRSAISAVIVILLSQSSDAQIKSNSLMEKSDGRFLRAALDARVEEDHISENFHFRVDVAKLVIKFIPIGSSIERAEVILRNAGLSVRHVDPQEASPAARPAPKLAAVLEYSGGAFRKSFIQIGVYAASGRQASYVGRITALITNSSL